MAIIKGTTITLHQRVQTGVDGQNNPTYEEIPVQVKGVLICPVSTDDITGDVQSEGKRAEYELLIPKDCTLSFDGCIVEFYGARWEVFGFPLVWMAENTPGDWNRKVKVERYG